jgi:hypothetical protein
MLHNIPGWARPAAKTGLVFGTISVVLLSLASFIAVVIPQLVLGQAGDYAIIGLCAIGSLAFIGAQLCAVVIYFQGVNRHMWR